MTGFVPVNYAPIADVRDALGIDLTGQLLAAGSLRGHAQDVNGRLLPIDRAAWLKPGARDLLVQGSLTAPAAGHVSSIGYFLAAASVQVPLFVTVEDLQGHAAVMKAMDQFADSPIGNAGWHPADGESLTAWAIRPAVVAEAERRVRSAGGALSEARTCAALDVMWTEAGKVAGAESISSLRRRARRT